MAEPLRQIRPEPVSGPLGEPMRGEETLPAAGVEESRAARQAYRALHVGFTVAPLVAGLDKFAHVLVDWDQYLAPIVPRVTGIDAHTFMLGVGVIEIAAGIGVALKPRIFGYVVSAWLAGIVVNLLIAGDYYDIALRDVGLSIGASALARLGKVFDRGRIGRSPSSSGITRMP